MFCPNCGAQIEDGAPLCPHCGTPILAANSQSAAPGDPKKAKDKPSALLAFLSALLPAVGLILFFVYEKRSPYRAKSCFRGALIGVALILLLFVIFLIRLFR